MDKDNQIAISLITIMAFTTAILYNYAKYLPYGVEIQYFFNLSDYLPTVIVTLVIQSTVILIGQIWSNYKISQINKDIKNIEILKNYESPEEIIKEKSPDEIEAIFESAAKLKAFNRINKILSLIGNFSYYIAVLVVPYSSLIIAIFEYKNNHYYHSLLMIFALYIIVMAQLIKNHKFIENIISNTLTKTIEEIEFIGIMNMKEIIQAWLFTTVMCVGLTLTFSMNDVIPPYFEGKDEVYFNDGKIFKGRIIGLNSNYLFIINNDDFNTMIISKNSINYFTESKHQQ